MAKFKEDYRLLKEENRLLKEERDFLRQKGLNPVKTRPSASSKGSDKRRLMDSSDSSTSDSESDSSSEEERRNKKKRKNKKKENPAKFGKRVWSRSRSGSRGRRTPIQSCSKRISAYKEHQPQL
ncbi:nucleolar protein 58-like isoform X2 [Dicentrarchus labrax]|uniref:nucleolar protein 58-like isoform X2 n=1 Tax=Dicentrarchus labrax TaxID=13489 RepID=UPI0021F57517|nr:nucleolar protein 58-like isoform X2 [Dicentrarchus labrax]